MGYHLVSVSLVFDIFGASLLAWALARGSLQTYIATTRSGDTMGIPASADLSRGEDIGDAQAGAPLLILGFVGQAVAAEDSGIAACLGGWAWLFLLLLVPAGVWWRWRRYVATLKIIRARLFHELGQWETVASAYEIATRGRDRRPGTSRHSLLEEVFADRWAKMEEELRTRKKEFKNAGDEWVRPSPPPMSYRWTLRNWRRWFRRNAFRLSEN